MGSIKGASYLVLHLLPAHPPTLLSLHPQGDDPRRKSRRVKTSRRMARPLDPAAVGGLQAGVRASYPGGGVVEKRRSGDHLCWSASALRPSGPGTFTDPPTLLSLPPAVTTVEESREESRPRNGWPPSRPRSGQWLQDGVRASSCGVVEKRRCMRQLC